MPEKPSFTNVSGIAVKPEDTSPLGFLNLLIDEDMMSSIVIETNRYAAASLVGGKLSGSSRFKHWEDVTMAEMRTFFGLIIAMGLIVVDDLQEYWSSHPVCDLPFFRSVMKRDRFLIILCFLHLSNNEQQLDSGSPNYDPIFKIRSFVDSLTANLKRVYVPGAHIAIDESMIAWRGPVAFRACASNNPVKQGIKVYELCDSESSYCCNLEFNTVERPYSNHGATFELVERLITPYMDAGRTLYADDFYSSPQLFTQLKQKNTLACGTIRLNRLKGLPNSLLIHLKNSDVPISSITNDT